MTDPADLPTPEGIPFLGNAPAFLRDPTTAFEAWASHGDLVRLRFLGDTQYLVTHPDHIEEILVGKDHAFTIGPDQQAAFEGIEDDAMTVATGDRWRRLRRAAHPAFTRETIDAYSERMATTTARFVDRMETDEPFDLAHEMRTLTVQILGATLLDVDLAGREALLIDAADAVLDKADFRRPGQLLPAWIPTPTDRRFRRSVSRLDAFVEGIVHRRRTTDDEAATDACSILLAAHEAGELSIAEVRDNLVAFMLAGHESPSRALTMALFLLADHPAHVDRVRAEFRDVVDGEVPTADDYPDLTVAGHVIDETLRLYPPTTGVGRMATESVDVGGYTFPADSRFLLPQWVPHRDERWWDRPTRFDPDRWVDPAPDRPEYAYFPFSGGPRACIGNDFARLELTVALATLLDRVDVSVEIDGPLAFRPTIQLQPTTAITATASRRPGR